MVLSKTLRGFFVGVLFLLSIQNLHSEYSIEVLTEFLILQEYSNKGDYKAGLFYVNKLEKRVVEEVGEESLDFLELSYYSLRFNYELSRKDEFEKGLLKFKQLYQKMSVKDNNRSRLLSITFHLVNLYYLQGDYQATIPYLRNFEGEFPENTYESNRLNYYQIISKYKRGELKTAEKDVDLGIVRAKSLCLNDSLERSFELFSDLVEIKVQLLLEQGQEDRAQETIEVHEKVLTEGLKNKKEYPSLNSFYRGIVFYKKGEFKLAEKQFKKASGIARSYYFDHTHYVTEIQQYLINSLLAQGKLEEAEYYNNLVDVNVIGYFGKRSLPYLANNYKDIQHDIYNSYWEKAQSSLIEFIHNPVLPEKHKLRESALKDLVIVMSKNLEFKRADSLLVLLADLQHDLYGSGAPVIFFTRLWRAAHYTTFYSEFDVASRIYNKYNEQLLLKELMVSNSAYLNVVLDKVRLFVYLEKFDEAIDLLERNCNLLKDQKSDKCPEYAILKAEYSAVKGIIGEYKDANNSIEEAAKIFAENNSIEYFNHKIRVFEIQAKLNMLEGDFSEVERLLFIINGMLKRGNLNESVYLTEDMGLLYIQVGRHQKAQRFLESLLENKIEVYGPDHRELISVYNVLSTLHVEQGNYYEAEYYIKQSLQISESVFGKNSLIYSEVLMEQRQLFDALGDNENSAKAIDEVLSIFTKLFGENNPKVAMAQHESVVMKAKLSLLNMEALELQLNHSLVVIEKEIGSKSTAYALGLENAARYFLIKEDLIQAHKELQKAKNIWEEVASGENISLARVNMLMGRIEHKKKEYASAFTSFSQARSIYKKLFNTNHPGYIAALGKCAQLQYCLGATEQSVKLIEEAVSKSLDYVKNIFPLLSERGKSAFWALISEDFEFYKTLAFQHSNDYPNMVATVFNLQLQTRSILLNSTLKLKRKIYGSENDEAIAIYQRLIAERELVARVYSMSESKRKEQGYNLSDIEHNVEKLEKELSGVYTGYNTEKRKEYTWEKVREYLGDDEVLIEVIPFQLFEKDFIDSTWYVFIALDHETKSVSDLKFVVNKNGNNLETREKSMYRNCMKFEKEDNSSYYQFWKPLEPLIGADKKTIIIVNDGIYNNINLETIQTPEKNFLIDKYNFIRIGTGRELFNRYEGKHEKNDTSMNISLFGNPQYYLEDTIREKPIGQLPGSETEVQNIGNYLKDNGWKVDLKIYAQAEESYFKNIENFKVVHIGTHGFYLPENKDNNLAESGVGVNPLLRSGLLFRGGGDVLGQNSMALINSVPGVLTAYEAMNMSLDNTELIVLSACETGLGEVRKGEGVMGLQRAFLVAGGKSIIVSLFEVSDEVTEKLMLLFYKNWISGMDKHTAFLEAKKSIMLESHLPIYWGAFIMTGIN